MAGDGVGFLWVGTENGLARFDGQEFNVFNTRNTPGLNNNIFTSLPVSGTKYLWIGTQGGGVTLYNGLRFRSFTGENLLPNSFIQSITSDLDGHVIISMCDGGIVGVFRRFNRWQVKKIHHTLPGECFSVVFEDSQKDMWLGTSKGLKYVKQRRVTLYTE